MKTKTYIVEFESCDGTKSIKARTFLEAKRIARKRLLKDEARHNKYQGQAQILKQDENGILIELAFVYAHLK